MRHPISIALAAAALLWTAAAETSDPTLAARDFPPDILSACAGASVPAAACSDEEAYVSRWVRRTPHGNLFLVLDTRCQPNGCRAWLVEREARAARTLLAISGQVRLEGVAAAYPTVQTRSALTQDHASYQRYEWNGRRYVRAETRLVHRVGQLECANEAECHAAASDALEHDQSGQAVQIWQKVHGISWI